MADGSLNHEIGLSGPPPKSLMITALRDKLGGAFCVEATQDGFEILLGPSDQRPYTAHVIKRAPDHGHNSIDHIVYIPDFVVTGIIRMYLYQGSRIATSIEYNRNHGTYLVNGRPKDQREVLELLKEIKILFSHDPEVATLITSIAALDIAPESIQAKPTVDQIHSFDQLRGFDPEILHDAIRHSLSEQLGKKRLPSVRKNEAPITVDFSYNANENTLSVVAETAGFCVTLHLPSGTYTYANKQIDREDLLDRIADLPINAADSLGKFLLLTDEARGHFFQLIDSYIRNTHTSGREVPKAEGLDPEYSSTDGKVVKNPANPEDSLVMKIYNQGGRLVAGIRAAAAALLVALSSRAA